MIHGEQVGDSAHNARGELRCGLVRPPCHEVAVDELPHGPTAKVVMSLTDVGL